MFLVLSTALFFLLSPCARGHGPARTLSSVKSRHRRDRISNFMAPLLLLSTVTAVGTEKESRFRPLELSTRRGAQSITINKQELILARDKRYGEIAPSWLFCPCVSLLKLPRWWSITRCGGAPPPPPTPHTMSSNFPHLSQGEIWAVVSLKASPLNLCSHRGILLNTGSLVSVPVCASGSHLPGMHKVKEPVSLIRPHFQSNHLFEHLVHISSHFELPEITISKHKQKHFKTGL